MLSACISCPLTLRAGHHTGLRAGAKGMGMRKTQFLLSQGTLTYRQVRKPRLSCVYGGGTATAQAGVRTRSCPPLLPPSFLPPAPHHGHLWKPRRASQSHWHSLRPGPRAFPPACSNGARRAAASKRSLLTCSTNFYQMPITCVSTVSVHSPALYGSQ